MTVNYVIQHPCTSHSEGHVVHVVDSSRYSLDIDRWMICSRPITL